MHLFCRGYLPRSEVVGLMLNGFQKNPQLYSNQAVDESSRCFKFSLTFDIFRLLILSYSGRLHVSFNKLMWYTYNLYSYVVHFHLV